jgi:hypothetical protein
VLGRPGSCGRTAEGVRLRPRSTTTVYGPRVLVRRAPASPPRRARRIAAGLAVVLAAAAVVFGLGRLADATSQARASGAPVVAVGEVTVTVHAPGTVWDVVDGVAPGASGPQRAAMVDRTVAANSLTSVRVWPGEVLRVPLR